MKSFSQLHEIMRTASLKSSPTTKALLRQLLSILVQNLLALPMLQWLATHSPKPTITVRFKISTSRGDLHNIKRLHRRHVVHPHYAIDKSCSVSSAFPKAILSHDSLFTLEIRTSYFPILLQTLRCILSCQLISEWYLTRNSISWYFLQTDFQLFSITQHCCMNISGITFKTSCLTSATKIHNQLQTHETIAQRDYTFKSYLCK